MLNQKIKELLKVLTLSEEEQWEWLISRQDIQEMCQNQLDSWSQPKCQRRVLADLAFRLRDVFHDPLGEVFWDKACWEVWAYEQKRHDSNILERKHLTLETKERYCNGWVNFWATPRHWVIISLVAKELLTDSNAKVEETEDSVEYLKSIEWSMGCGGNRNEGQCPECCGCSEKWAEGANKSWMKQFGCKRVKDENIGHTPKCKLGNALKGSLEEKERESKEKTEEYFHPGVWEEGPESLRVPMYAIGQDDGKGGYGMWDGPNSSVLEMLNVDGRDNNSVIVRFNTDGTHEVMYRWNSEVYMFASSGWKRVINHIRYVEE